MKKREFGFLVLASGCFFLLLMAGCAQGPSPTPTATPTPTPTPTATPTSLCPTATLRIQAPASAMAGQEITFEVRVTGTLTPGTTFLWDFGDGTENQEGPTVSHTYASGGEDGITYTVTVTAQLPPGYESCTPPSATFEVFVAPAPVHNRTQNTFYDSIQEAIDEAENGDVIVVAPGTYRESIDFLGKNLTLQNANPSDSSLVARTIIEGRGGSVVTFKNGCTQARLLGFTIQGGSGTNVSWVGATAGGGIYIENASPIIEGNWIQGNSVRLDGGGGGIFILGSSYPQIINNRIENNQANRGGGIAIGDGSFPVIYGNTIRRNRTVNVGSVRGLGGGMYVHTSGGVKDEEGNFWPRENCPPAGQVSGSTWNYQGNTFSDNYNADGATEGCHVYFRNIVINL